MARFTDLPMEVLMNIANHLQNQADVLDLALVSKAWNAAATERLYQSKSIVVADKKRMWNTTYLQSATERNINRLTQTLRTQGLQKSVTSLVLMRTNDNIEMQKACSRLLTLAVTSIKYLQIQQYEAGWEGFLAELSLPKMPKLATLLINQNHLSNIPFWPKVTVEDLYKQRNLGFAPRLQHLSLTTDEILLCRKLKSLLQSAPLLSALRLVSEGWLIDKFNETENLPTGLVGILAPLTKSLESLIFFTRDASDEEIVHYDDCLSCRTGSFSDLNKLRHLSVPLCFLMCDRLTPSHYGGKFDNLAKTWRYMLPSSLQDLQLQISCRDLHKGPNEDDYNDNDNVAAMDDYV